MALDESAMTDLLAALRGAGWRGGRLPVSLPAHTAFPYVFLDATCLKARVDSRVVAGRW